MPRLEPVDLPAMARNQPVQLFVVAALEEKCHRLPGRPGATVKRLLGEDHLAAVDLRIFSK
jgi:hypothetical protein